MNSEWCIRNIERADREPPTAACVRLGHRARSHGRVGCSSLHAADLRRRAGLRHAVTVLLHPGDNWMMHVAAEQIP